MGYLVLNRSPRFMIRSIVNCSLRVAMFDDYELPLL
jgi:hypothetical protein